MKAKDIVDGLRVRVKKSSSLSGLVGTVVGVPYFVFVGLYVKVVLDVVDTPDDCHTIGIGCLEYSNETPEIGGRVIVRSGGGTYWYKDGAGGSVRKIDGNGDVWVEFDSGVYAKSHHGIWCAAPNQLAIIREVV